MIVSIDVEDAAWNSVAGLDALSRRACEAALSKTGADGRAVEAALLFTDDEEMAVLNGRWRGKNKPTNVLSFPASPDPPVPAGEARPLGDIVLAFGTVSREAAEQRKSLESHTAHLIVHGCLHLLGYDHVSDADAQTMEELEIGILAGLGIGNPYLETHERS